MSARAIMKPSAAAPTPVIAVVDDDPSVLRALARLIRSRGGLAATFSCGADLLQAIREKPPDCLIVDVQMPRMNGFSLQTELSALGLKLPIIFITAHEDEQARQLAFRNGAAAFLYKPFSDDVLWGAVAATLSKKQSAAPPQ